MSIFSDIRLYSPVFADITGVTFVTSKISVYGSQKHEFAQNIFFRISVFFEVTAVTKVTADAENPEPQRRKK